MTEKELRKLKRSDFLRLLIAQGRDLTEVQKSLDETTADLARSLAANEGLSAKLAEKDEQIRGLKVSLESRDATIDTLRQEIEDMKAIMKAIRWTGSEQNGSDAAPKSLDEIYTAMQAAKAERERRNRRRGRKKR